jgi:hypothetical protein
MIHLDSIDSGAISNVIGGALDKSRICGKTHQFYRYPARFSPSFVKEVIKTFTNPGDLIIDPFVGGGTTAVEARALSRLCIGIDINSLAIFISKVKTTPLSFSDIKVLTDWKSKLKVEVENNKMPKLRDEKWFQYHKNIGDVQTWRTRRLIEIALETVCDLTPRQENFARCTILKTSQWALDSKKEIPPVGKFKEYLFLTINEMLNSIKEFSSEIRDADKLCDRNSLKRTLLLNRNTVGIESDNQLSKYGSPKLILTSPPYPGVHVLYHRWQVQGRRETPAPYWIANKLDGSGESNYTFGSRQQPGLISYFENVFKTFSSLAKLSDDQTNVIQMIAFSEPDWQLPLYLEVLEDAGFCEKPINGLEDSVDRRLWRNVPNRKWYTGHVNSSQSNKEVVLFHKLKAV